MGLSLDEKMVALMVSHLAVNLVGLMAEWRVWKKVVRWAYHWADKMAY